MPGKTIQDLLGFQTLTGLIQATTQGIPDVLPAGFTKAAPKKVVGDAGEYTRVTGTKDTAQLVFYGSKAKLRNLKDVAVQPVKLLHAFEEMRLSPMMFQALRNYTDYNHMGYTAEDEVTRQVKNFKQRFDNLDLVAALMVLSKGKIYQDSDGNVLYSSSGAAVTTDFGWTANTNDFEGYGDSATATGGPSASWATAGTNIPLAIRKLKAYALKLTGYEIKCAFYGANIPEYFTANNYLANFLYRDPTRRSGYLKEGDLMPEYELEGIKFYPVYTAFYEDYSGTNRTIFGDNQIVFTPEPSGDWWERLEGSYPVPTTNAIQADASAAMGSFKHIHGKFAYAAVSHNPSAVSMYAGWTGLPVLKVPNAVLNLADVTAAGS